MNKMVLIIFGVVLLLVLGVGGWFWYQSGKPFYEPGMVRRGERLSAPLTPPVQPVDSPTWLVEPGIDLAHFADGQGRKVLVVHGGPGAPFLEPAVGLSALGDHYRFHYYDQRGCGDSTRPIDRFDSKNMYENMQTLDQTLGIGAQLADMERIRQILGEDKLILVGHSWGGFLASMYAAEFPDHVEALILVSPANVLIMPQPEAESDLFASVRAGLPEEEQAAYDDLMKRYMDFKTLFDKSEQELVALNEEFGAYFIRIIGGVEEMPVQGKSGGWMVWAQYISMGQRHDYSKALADVNVPVLVVHAADDIQSETVSGLYAEAFPNAKMVVIEDASHSVFTQQPEAFSSVVAEFLNSLP